jgi:hypothetical protein
LHNDNNDTPYNLYQNSGNVTQASIEDWASVEEHLRLSSGENSGICSNEWLIAPNLVDGEALEHIMHSSVYDFSFDGTESNHVQQLPLFPLTEQNVDFSFDIGSCEDASTEFSNNLLDSTSHTTVHPYASIDVPLISNAQPSSLTFIADSEDVTHVAGKLAIPRAECPYACPHCSENLLDNARLQ